MECVGVVRLSGMVETGVHVGHASGAQRVAAEVVANCMCAVNVDAVGNDEGRDCENKAPVGGRKRTAKETCCRTEMDLTYATHTGETNPASHDVRYHQQHQQQQQPQRPPSYASDAESCSSNGSSAPKKSLSLSGLPPVSCVSSSSSLKLDSRRPLKASRLICKSKSKHTAAGAALSSATGWNSLKAFHRPKSKDDYSNPEACVHYKFGGLRRNWSFLQLSSAASRGGLDAEEKEQEDGLRCVGDNGEEENEKGEKRVGSHEDESEEERRREMLLLSRRRRTGRACVSFDLQSMDCAAGDGDGVHGEGGEREPVGAVFEGAANRSMGFFSPVSTTSVPCELPNRSTIDLFRIAERSKP